MQKLNLKLFCDKHEKHELLYMTDHGVSFCDKQEKQLLLLTTYILGL